MISAEEFNEEINKLITRFDKKFYPKEVIEIIFNEIRYLKLEWLKKTISLFLGQHRPALLPEFKEHSKIEKDKNREIPELNARPHPSDNSIFTKEDISEMIGMIKKRINREITYEELDSYEKMIQNALNSTHCTSLPE